MGREQRLFFLRLTGTYLGMILLLTAASIWLSGQFTYVLDDAYIHLTMARNLGTNGTYGVVPGLYESASSAPAWTLLLAGLIRLAPGLLVWWPLLLNVAAGVWLIRSLAANDQYLAFQNGTVSKTAALLLPVILFLPPLAMTGMEHTLHAALTLQLLVWFRRLLAGDADRRVAVAFYVLLALAALVRFETLFLAGGFALAHLAGSPLRWRPPDWRAMVARLGPALLMVAAAALPVAAVGAVNLLQGQYFMPNSVVAKTALGQGAASGLLPHPFTILANLLGDPLLLLVLVLIAAYLRAAWRSRDEHGAPMAVAVLTAAVLHLAYASVGPFERYHVYLLVAGAHLIMRAASAGFLPRKRSAISIGLTLLLLCSARKIQLTALTPIAANNIYEQQNQMALFLAEFYQDRTVAVNDLGLVAFHHEGPVVDLIGLGSNEVLQARKQAAFGSDYLEGLIHDRNVPVIVIYERWFEGDLPNSWKRVAEWSLSRMQVTPFAATIAFYAPTQVEAGELAENLRRFESRLPTGVGVRYDP